MWRNSVGLWSGFLSGAEWGGVLAGVAGAASGGADEFGVDSAGTGGTGDRLDHIQCLIAKEVCTLAAV